MRAESISARRSAGPLNQLVGTGLPAKPTVEGAATASRNSSPEAVRRASRRAAARLVAMPAVRAKAKTPAKAQRRLRRVSLMP